MLIDCFNAEGAVAREYGGRLGMRYACERPLL